MTGPVRTSPPEPSPPAADRLLSERDELIRRAGRLDLDLAGMVAASLDSNADDEHDPEGQTIAYERSQLSALAAQVRHDIAEVEAALARMAAGTYGTCEVCHRSIPPARLDARPTARTCVEHAPQRPRR